jgi:prepilin-type N-terminal cleavage/methylation domain-containing protein
MRRVNWRLERFWSGFSLIEILIGLAVVAMLVGLVASAISQTGEVNASSGARTEAIRQLDVSIDTISRDIQMAQQVSTGGSAGFPLCLSWKGWDNTACLVTYWLDGTQLRRGVALNGGPQVDTILAGNISSIQVKNLPYSAGALTVSITSSIEAFRSASESRTFQVLPRTGT